MFESSKCFHLLTIGIVIFLQINAESTLIPNSTPENARLDFTGLALRYGHRVKRYEVITEDGYILTLYRIPGRSKYPVLLMHGLLDSSDTWLIRGDESLGITLANDNFDLWFGNSRGNRYSRRHVSLDPDRDPSYWKWTFHHLGYYDLPAIIDTILNETRASSVSAFGHSRGNTMFYVLGATRREYNSKINILIALAPVCYFANSKPPVSTALEAFPVLNQLLIAMRLEGTEILGYNNTVTRLVRHFCTFSTGDSEVCLNSVLFPAAGFDPKELEPSFINVLAYHFPAGTSWLDFVHFGQIRVRGVFAQFDYGTQENLKVYKSTSPPLYNLAHITMPIALLAARNDHLSTLPDVAILRHQLPNVADYIVNKRLLFNHLDDVWGRRMRIYLFPDIYKVLLKYNGVDNSHH